MTEIVVEHHPRQFGVSKYGIERFIRGFSDMLTMGFLRVYRERPSHLANAFAAGYGACGFGLVAAGLVFGPTTTSGLACWLIALVLVAMGGASVLAGLFAELMIRQNHNLTAQDAVVVDTNFTSTTNTVNQYVVEEDVQEYRELIEA